MDTIGDRIKAVAEAKNMSVRGLAIQCGIPPVSMHNYTAGRTPPADVVGKVVNATGCSFPWLVLNEGPMFAETTFDDRLRAAAAVRDQTVQVMREAMDDLPGPVGPGVRRPPRSVFALYHAAAHCGDPEIATVVRRTIRVFLVAAPEIRERLRMQLELVDPGEKKAGLERAHDTPPPAAGDERRAENGV